MTHDHLRDQLAEAIHLHLRMPRPEGHAMTDHGQHDQGETIGRAFHETYERLAPDHGYRTREASAKPWADVPENNRALMVAVVRELLERGTIRAAAQPGDEGGRRAAQIQAALDALERLTSIPALQRTALAAEVVDAVNAAGRETAEVEHLARPFSYREPANRVTLYVTYQGSDGLAFVAQPHREVGQPYEQYGVVLPWDIARTLAQRVLASEPAQRPETVPDGADRAGEDAGSAEAETGGSGWRDGHYGPSNILPDRLTIDAQRLPSDRLGGDVVRYNIRRDGQIIMAAMIQEW